MDCKAFISDHTSRIKYYLMAVIFSAFVLPFNVSTFYLKTNNGLTSRTNKLGLNMMKNLQRYMGKHILYTYTKHKPPPCIYTHSAIRKYTWRKQVHISQDKHFQSAKYGQRISTNINKATHKSK